MWPCTSMNGLPWPDSAKPRVQLVDHVRASSGTRRSGRASSRSRSTARCVRAGGRPRSAAAARAGTGTRATGAWPGVSTRRPGARGRFRSRRRAISVAVGLDHARDPGGACPAMRSAYCSSAGSGHAALAADLEAARERTLGIARRSRSRADGSGASTTRSRSGRGSSPPGPSGRRGRACRRAAAPGRRSGPPGPSPARVPPSIPARACRCRTARRPSSGRDRPRVAVRHAGQRQRQPQAPQSGYDPLTPSELPSARHARARYPSTDLDSGARMSSADVATALLRGARRARHRRQPLACWAPGGVERVVGQRELTAPAGIREFLERAVRRVSRSAATRCSMSTAADGTARRVPLAGARHVRRPGRLPGLRAPTARASRWRAATSSP